MLSSVWVRVHQHGACFAMLSHLNVWRSVYEYPTGRYCAKSTCLEVVACISEYHTTAWCIVRTAQCHIMCYIMLFYLYNTCTLPCTFQHDLSAALLVLYVLCASVSPFRFVGCLGQQEFLTVNVVPVSTTSVKASFTPPNDTVEYSVQYMFGEGDFTMFATQLVSLDGMGEQTVQLRDPDALPGMLVQVRMNSSLNLTYPITQAWTCNSGTYVF